MPYVGTKILLTLVLETNQCHHHVTSLNRLYLPPSPLDRHVVWQEEVRRSSPGGYLNHP